MKKLLLPLIIFVFCSVTSNAQWAYDSVTFEQPTPKIVINPSANNLWQIGSPQKTFFNSAHTGAKAIVTDTINNYPPNDTSSFTYIIHNAYTSTCATCLEFWHKYDMDSIADKGIIDASYDGGNSWITVKDTFVGWGSIFQWDYDYHDATGMYSPHSIVTSGKSDGWIKSRICWTWWIALERDTIITNPDSLMIRFTFISDTITHNKEGWMVDDILTSAAQAGMCSGINEYDKSENVTISPNPLITTATIRFSGEQKNTTIKIMNTLGECVLTSPPLRGGREGLLDLSNLSKGIYFLQINNDKGTVNKKLIKQ